MIWLNVAMAIFLFQVATILLFEFRRPAKGFAWMVILFLFPILGILMYYFLARDYRQRTKVRRGGLLSWGAMMRSTGSGERALLPLGGGDDGGVPPQRVRLQAMLHSLPEAMLTHCNQATLMRSPEQAYRHMLADMENARDHIHLLYYTFNHDVIGKQYQRVLVRKAQEGVKVRIIFDGIGSYATSRHFWQTLRKAGAQVHCFLPALIAFFDKRINYRNHRKLTIIDGEIGYVGGANIGDEYLGKHARLGYWRDVVMRLEGECVHSLQRCFLKDWYFVGREHVAETTLLFPTVTLQPRLTVQIVPSGPDRDGEVILEMLFASFNTARRRIWFTTPYFIPDRSLTMALKCAALVGIDVRIIIPGEADTHVPLWATLSYLEELLQHGVRVFRYAKGFMHAKVIVVDDDFLTIGSANVDLRSMKNNFELNAVFFERSLVETVVQEMENDFNDSVEVLYETFIQRSRWKRGQEAIGRVFSPLL